MRWRRRRPPEPSQEDFLGLGLFVPTDLRVGADDEEGAFLTAFTSEEGLRAFAPESESTLPLRGSNVLHFLLETDCAGVVVDPGSAESYVIYRSTAEEMAGPASDDLWEGPKVLLAAPDEPPPASLAESLRTACEQDPRVEAAYVFLAAVPGREEHAQPVLGLELSSGDQLSDELIAALQGTRVASPAEAKAGLGGYASMDIRVLDQDLLETIREIGIPIYRRGGTSAK